MTKERLKSIGLWLLLAPTLIWPTITKADVLSCPADTEPTRGGLTCLPKPGEVLAGFPFVETFSEGAILVLNILLTVVGLVAVLFLVIGGFQYITAGGEEEKIKSAKKRIYNSLIGLAVVLLALALVRIVANLVAEKV